MLMSMRYRLVRTLIRLLLRCGVDERDLERAVLCHQLKILRRGALYAGTDDGVFRSADGGSRWTHFNTGFKDGGIDALALDAAFSVLYAGTDRGSVFVARLGGYIVFPSK